MKKYIFTFYLSVTLLIESFACECRSISKSEDFIASDVVFIGEVIDVNKLSFEIKPHEFFKSKTSDTLISDIDDCSIIPKKGEIWLFYATNSNVNKIYISRCGSSRSFNSPFSFNSNNFPEPPPANVDDGSLKLIDELSKDKALSELHYDIATLRHLKIQENQQRVEAGLSKVTEHIKLLIWTSASCVILLILLGAIVFRSRQRR